MQHKAQKPETIHDGLLSGATVASQLSFPVAAVEQQQLANKLSASPCFASQCQRPHRVKNWDVHMDSGLLLLNIF